MWPAMAAPELKIQPDDDVDFDALYMNMGSYIAAQLEAKGPDGERLYGECLLHPSCPS